MDPAEERGQRAEVVLLPVLERVVVALAQSIRAPRNARETRAASRSGSGSSASGSNVTETKFVAGWSVHTPRSAISSRTIDEYGRFSSKASLSQEMNRRRRNWMNGPSSVPTRARANRSARKSADRRSRSSSSSRASIRPSDGRASNRRISSSDGTVPVNASDTRRRTARSEAGRRLDSSLVPRPPKLRVDPSDDLRPLRQSDGGVRLARRHDRGRSEHAPTQGQAAGDDHADESQVAQSHFRFLPPDRSPFHFIPDRSLLPNPSAPRFRKPRRPMDAASCARAQAEPFVRRAILPIGSEHVQQLQPTFAAAPFRPEVVEEDFPPRLLDSLTSTHPKQIRQR